MTLTSGFERGTSTPGMRVVCTSHLNLAVERPDGYPVETVVRDGLTVCLEGHVYRGDRAALVARLTELRTIAHHDAALAGAVRAVVEAVDGDFALAWYDDASRRLVVAADRLGRLPLYYGATDGGVAIARDLHFVLAQASSTAIDSLALAQLLLFGYPLGARTLSAHTSRLLPREVLVASPRGWQVVPSPGSPFARPAAARAPEGLAECAQALREAFVASCRDRSIQAGSHILSLSGGIDSRITGAGMRAVLPSFAAVTFAAPGSSHADERNTAAAVAGTLGVSWRSYQFEHADPEHIDGIIRMKLGLNPVDVAFGIDYVRRVRADFPGPVAFWTGEGADKLLCEHRCIPRRASLDELVRFILDKNAVMAPSLVAALTGVGMDDLVASVRSAVAEYDVDAEDAYVHFLLSQRVVRFHTEGEDRHRAFVWPLAPFFGADFVSLARAIPGEAKRGRRLYRAFLRALAPDLAALPLAGGHAAPASTRFALEYAARERLRNSRTASALYRRVRAARASRRSAGGPWHAMLGHLVHENAIPEPLRAAEVARVVGGAVPVSSSGVCMILTTALAIRAILGAGEP